MRTPTAVRHAAARHFAKVIEYAVNEEAVAAAREDEALGMRLVDALLQTPADGLFPLNEYLPSGLTGVDAFAQAMRVLPFLTGSLRLVEWEFANPAIGVVPYDIVRKLLDGDTVTHDGVELTAAKVFLQYRRRPLD